MGLKAPLATTPITQVLTKLDGARQGSRGWLGVCPAHDDRHASLSIAEGRDGRVLIHCFSGCETAQVLKALDLEWRDLFPPPPSGASTGGGRG